MLHSSSTFGRRAGVTLSLTWSGAEKLAYSALISGFEHLLGIIMEKTDFLRHFSILSPKLCFRSFKSASIRLSFSTLTRIAGILCLHFGGCLLGSKASDTLFGTLSTLLDLIHVIHHVIFPPSTQAGKDCTTSEVRGTTLTSLHNVRGYR